MNEEVNPNKVPMKVAVTSGEPKIMSPYYFINEANGIVQAPATLTPYSGCQYWLAHVVYISQLETEQRADPIFRIIDGSETGKKAIYYDGQTWWDSLPEESQRGEIVAIIEDRAGWEGNTAHYITALYHHSYGGRTPIEAQHRANLRLILNTEKGWYGNTAKIAAEKIIESWLINIADQPETLRFAVDGTVDRAYRVLQEALLTTTDDAKRQQYIVDAIIEIEQLRDICWAGKVVRGAEDNFSDEPPYAEELAEIERLNASVTAQEVAELTGHICWED